MQYRNVCACVCAFLCSGARTQRMFAQSFSAIELRRHMLYVVGYKADILY